MIKYCTEEKAELENFRNAYQSKKAELVALNEKLGAYYSETEHSAKSIARAIASGEKVSLDTKNNSLTDKHNELARIVNLLQTATAEQKRHVADRLRQTYAEVYPAHLTVVKARAKFEAALKLIQEGIDLDIEGNKMLAADGLPVMFTWSGGETAQFFEEFHRRKAELLLNQPW